MTAFSPYQAYPADPTPFVPQGPPPILVATADPAPQSRATVAFRLILAIPHFIVLYVLSIAAGFVLMIGWIAALFIGRLPEFAATFLSGYLRWTSRVYSYWLLLTDVYPPFSFEDDPMYPVRVAIPPAQSLNRAAVFFRIILLIPANIVGSVVTFGASVITFFAWLITLVTGQLPASMHLALTAVLRYMIRLNGYYWMLTPAYPSGLYGDQPGTVTWADGMPTGVTPGFGTPASLYGTPGVPAPTPFGTPEPGYQAPGYQAPGYQPTEYQVPGYQAPGYQAPGYQDAVPGYGVASGYQGPVAGYGQRSVFEPATWVLLLTAGARRLMNTFIAFGVLFWIGYVALIAVLVAAGGTVSSYATAANAIPKLDAAYTTLGGNLNTWETSVKACGGSLSCVTPLDAQAAGYFSTFANELAATPVPSGATAAAATLHQDAVLATQDFTELSRVTSTAQYQSTVSSTHLQQTLANFDTDYSALMENLSGY